MGNENKKTGKTKIVSKEKQPEMSSCSTNRNNEGKSKRPASQDNNTKSKKIVPCKSCENPVIADEENESFENIFRRNKIEEMIKWGPRNELLGLTPLAVLTVMGDDESLKKFIEAGADLNEKCQADGNTALLVAVQGKKLGTVEILLKHGAIVSEVNSYGNNALMLAIRTGDSRLVNTVWSYRKNLNINHQNMTGCTALHFAADKTWETCTQFLLSNGANPNIAHVGGWTPLTFAAMKGDKKVIEILTKAGSQILREDSIGSTALCYTIIEEKEECITYFMQVLSSKQKENYVKSRLDKLRAPKDEDVETYYEESLLPVILYLCKVEEIIKAFLYAYRLVPILLKVVRRYIKNKALMVLTSQILCSALYFENHCVDERFVDHFIRCQGPEFVLEIMRQYFSHDKSSPDTDGVWLSFMCLVVIVDSEPGRDWLTRNCARVQEYAVMFRDNVRFEYAPDGWLREIFEGLWVQFKSFFESIATTQCEKNFAELLAEEERENKKREKKRIKRKLKKQRQQQLKATVQQDNCSDNSLQASVVQQLPESTETSVPTQQANRSDVAIEIHSTADASGSSIGANKEERYSDSFVNEEHIAMDTNNNTKGSAARRRRKQNKSQSTSTEIEQCEDRQHNEVLYDVSGVSNLDFRKDNLPLVQEGMDKTLWIKVQPKRAGVKKAKQDPVSEYSNQTPVLLSKVGNTEKKFENTFITPVVAIPPPLRMKWSDVARGDSKSVNNCSKDGPASKSVDGKSTVSSEKLILPAPADLSLINKQHSPVSPYCPSEGNNATVHMSLCNEPASSVVSNNRSDELVTATRSTDMRGYAPVLSQLQQNHQQTLTPQSQCVNGAMNMTFPSFHSHSTYDVDQNTDDLAEGNKVLPNDETKKQNQPLTLHSIAKSLMSGTPALPIESIEKTNWGRNEWNKCGSKYVSVRAADNLSLLNPQTGAFTSCGGGLRGRENAQHQQRCENTYPSPQPGQSSRNSDVTANMNYSQNEHCNSLSTLYKEGHLQQFDLHLSLPDDMKEDTYSLEDEYDTELKDVPCESQAAHCLQVRDTLTDNADGRCLTGNAYTKRETTSKNEISEGSRESLDTANNPFHFPSSHRIGSSSPEKTTLPFLDKLEVLIAQQIKSTAQNIQGNKLLAESAYFHDLDFYASTLGMGLDTLLQNDLDKLSSVEPVEKTHSETWKKPDCPSKSLHVVSSEDNRDSQYTQQINIAGGSTKDNQKMAIVQQTQIPGPPDVMYKRTWVPKSRRWRSKMMEIFHLPPNMRFQIGEIVVPFEAYKYNINESGTPVVLGFMVDGSEVAVKMLDIPETARNVEQMRQLTSANSKHYFLATHRAFAFFDSRCYLAADLYEYTLEEYIQILNLENKMNVLSADKLVWQLIKGVVVLHETLNIVHGNMKPGSILIDVDGKLKVGNFGVLESDKGTPRSIFNTADDRCWKSTESLTGQDSGKPTFASDVQVMGMLIHYILTGGKHPFGESPFEIEVNICHGWMKLSFLSEEAADLLRQFLQPCPELRSTIVEALKHPYFWAEEKKFRFMLISGSDVLRDMKAGGAPSSPRIGPSMIDILNTPNTPEFVGCWMNLVDEVILKEMRQFRTYKNTLSEVVLFIYNCCLHFDKMSGECREVLDDPCKYFLRILPSLFMAVYNAIKGSDRKERTCYRPFF